MSSNFDCTTGTCSRPFVINNFNPTKISYSTLIVGLKLLIKKGLEQVPVTAPTWQ